MCVCVCTRLCIHMSTKTPLSPELELQAIMSHSIRLLGTKLGSFTKAVYFNHWAVLLWSQEKEIQFLFKVLLQNNLKAGLGNQIAKEVNKLDFDGL